MVMGKLGRMGLAKADEMANVIRGAIDYVYRAKKSQRQLPLSNK